MTHKHPDFFIPTDMFANGSLAAVGQMFRVCRMDGKIPYHRIAEGTGLSEQRIREIERGIHSDGKVNFPELIKLYQFFGEKITIIDEDFWAESPNR